MVIIIIMLDGITENQSQHNFVSSWEKWRRFRSLLRSTFRFSFVFGQPRM